MSETLRDLIDELDGQEGPSNYEEDNFEAGWHAALYDLRERVANKGILDHQIQEN